MKRIFKLEHQEKLQEIISIYSVDESLSKKEFKGSVSVISVDPPCKKCNVRSTMVILFLFIFFLNDLRILCL